MERVSPCQYEVLGGLPGKAASSRPRRRPFRDIGNGVRWAGLLQEWLDAPHEQV